MLKMQIEMCVCVCIHTHIPICIFNIYCLVSVKFRTRDLPIMLLNSWEFHNNWHRDTELFLYASNKLHLCMYMVWSKPLTLNLLLHNTYLLNKVALCKTAPLELTCHHLNHFMTSNFVRAYRDFAWIRVIPLYSFPLTPSWVLAQKEVTKH
jgi:hypothetical protein